jgi:hypothetical protein
LVVFNEVTRLLAQEDIINVSGSKSSASYNWIYIHINSLQDKIYM